MMCYCSRMTIGIGTEPIHTSLFILLLCIHVKHVRVYPLRSLKRGSQTDLPGLYQIPLGTY